MPSRRCRSGFVPFLQISTEEHKRAVSTSPKDARLRVYFSSEAARSTAIAAWTPVRDEMLRVSAAAEADILHRLHEMDDNERNVALTNVLWAMSDDGPFEFLDTFAADGAYGVEVPERLVRHPHARTPQPSCSDRAVELASSRCAIPQVAVGRLLLPELTCAARSALTQHLRARV
jgi:hypothetical protein